VVLTPKAVETLLVLIEHRDRVVPKDELLKLLWPDSFVEESNLSQNIFLLRKALGDTVQERRYILTVPGRGYQFMGTVQEIREKREEEESAPVESPSPLGSGPLQSGAQEQKPAPESDTGIADTSSEIPLRERPFPSQAQRIAEPAVLSAQKQAFSMRLIVLLGIVAMATVVVMVLVLHRSGPKATAQSSIKSIAVLPLKNLSGDPTQEYLADGMTEAVIGRLSAIHDLRVISRTSVMRFKDTQLSAPEIARMLGVDALVEGSVIREGSRIRVNAQLIRGLTDEHFWSEAYDRELRDILSLESDVAQSIARKVEVTVTGKEHERLTIARSVSPEVYESYLRGRFALNKGYNKASLEESIRYFDEAIKRDSAFAPAYGGLATAYRHLGSVIVGVPPTETRPKVLSAARKALELDPELAEAHVRLADLDQQLFQWNDAEAEYKRALELKPNDAATHLTFAFWLICQGRAEEAIAWSQRAREVELRGSSGFGLGSILFYARHYDEATEELRSALAVRPEDASTLWYLGFVLIAQGRPEEAIPVLEKALAVSDRSPAIIGVLVRAYAFAGRRADALHLLAELKKRKQANYIPAAAFVHAYLGLGEYDEAFVWFEQAYQEQSNMLQFLKVHPFYDPVREDPRFKDLVRRVGLN